MKKTAGLFILSFFICAYALKSQSIGIQVSSLIPVGNTAYILKPDLGVEFTFKSGKINSQFKLSGSVGFFAFKATQDTFRTIYGVQEGNKNVLVYPGYQVLKSYDIISIGVGCDYKVLKDKKLSPTIGIDGYTYIINYIEDYSVKIIKDSHGDKLTWEFAFCPKIGASYDLGKNYFFTAGIGRSMGVGPEGIQSFWKPYIGFNFYFDKK